MFKDHAVIYVRGGRGGDGCVAFRREKYVPKGGPSGGDGGHGGNVWIVADPQQSTLLSLVRHPHVRAKPGGHGEGRSRFGRKGEDAVVRVPVGTLVYDYEKKTLLRDLARPGDRVCVARGGRGGWGNEHFKSSTNQTPRNANPGQPGEERTIRLELKLIADVGLVGLPNAGKSTLIRRISAATPKVADYPFTTLEPHPGIVELDVLRRFVVVDVPGLIAGAADGQGLGHRFLKHLERTRVLVHLIDPLPADGVAPADAHRVIDEELSRYSVALAAKPRLRVLSKADLLDDPQAAAAALGEELGEPVFWVSAASGKGIDVLLEEVWRLLEQRTPVSSD